MIKQYQNSVIAQLLDAIISQVNFNGEPTSNIGDILLSILEQTPYDDEPKSVLAELFLKLKDKLEGRAFTPYDKEPKSALAEILLSILNETEYDKQPNSRIAELLLELKAELENYAELTASGAIANFTTSVVKPLVNLTAYFNATQEAGTPTPQSPKAISGVSAVNVTKCGVNLWDEEWEKGGYSSSDGQPYISNDRIRSKNYIPVEGGSSIYFYMGSSLGTLWTLCTYDSNHEFISDIGYNKQNRSINIPNNARYVRFTLSNSYGTTYLNDVSVNYPSTDTDYHAYNGSTTLINLGGTYYGGYVSQDKNGKRELVVNMAGVDLGIFTYIGYIYGGVQGWYASGISSQIAKPKANSLSICSIYKRAQNDQEFNSDGIDFEIYIPTDNLLKIKNSEYTDATAFKNAMQGVILYYELAEPFTVELPDGEPIIAFNGVNNVYNDSGDTSVTYLALISDNITRSAKARATLKAEKLKVKEQEEQKQIVLDPVEAIKEKPTKGA